MKFKSILLEIGKNLSFVLIGSIAGAIVAVWYGLHFWLPERIANLSPGIGVLFGTMALIIVTVILFSIVGVVLGGALSVLFYQTIKILRRKKKHMNRKK